MAKRTDLTEYTYRKARARFLAEQDVCHLCGHAGADTVDHVIPVSKGADPADRDNWLPAHGVNGCPTCGRRCNSEKGDRQAAAFRTSRDWYAGP